MIVLVMCETKLQFHNYVHAIIEDESKLPVKRTIIGDGSSRIIKRIDDLEFLFCRDYHILIGRTFSKNDYIVKVGSWYNIPSETQEKIVTQFMSRIIE